jgi:GNAT superfamily N-acetyltransferase
MTIYFDTARDESDVRQALELYIADENRELGLTREQRSSLEIEDEFRHWMGIYRSTPEGFMVARDNRKIIGVAAVALRPPQWMLTNFFVDPQYHGQGVGRELFRRALVMRHSATRFCLHASTHPNAQMLYLKSGLYPRPHSTWLQLEGERVQKLEISESTDLISSREALPEVLDRVNTWDRQLIGFEREVDHLWWSTTSDYYLLTQRNTDVGYFKISNNGHIGPLVVKYPELMPAALDLALLAAKKQTLSSRQRLLIPGENSVALHWLLNYGYRFDGVELLLSSEPLPYLSHIIFHDTDLL